MTLDRGGTELNARGMPGMGTSPARGGANAAAGQEWLVNCRVSVVIPARNEAKSLPHVLSQLPPWVYEVVLVDGLSEDDTSRVARLELPAIRIVEQSGRGKGSALREGFLYCTGDVVVALDADGSMDPTEMSRFVELVAEGYDYVKGSRMLTGGSSADLTKLRTFGNWIFRTLTNLAIGSRYSDLCYGYFAFRRGTVDTLNLIADGFEIETEINIRAHQAGLRIVEVPSAEAERRHGSSQLSAFGDGLRILFTIFRTALSRARIVAPAELSSWIGDEAKQSKAIPIAADIDKPDV